MKTLFLRSLLFFALSQSAMAQETDTAPAPSPTPEAPSLSEKVVESAEDSGEKLAKAVKCSRAAREDNDWFIYGGYAPLDLLLIGKWGITAGRQINADESWEFEYQKGSLAAPGFLKDLGSMGEERYSIVKRTYAGSNSFHFSYGLFYNRFDLQLGDKFLNRMSGGYTPSSELARVESYGAIVGLGSRWVFFKHYSLGLEWITWAQPLITAKKESIFTDRTRNVSDRDEVDTALNLVNYFPRFGTLKLQFGFLF